MEIKRNPLSEHWAAYWAKIPKEGRTEALRERWEKWRKDFPGFEQQRRERQVETTKLRLARLSDEQRRKKTEAARAARWAGKPKPKPKPKPSTRQTKGFGPISFGSRDSPDIKRR